jgi:hypothetical protein
MKMDTMPMLFFVIMATKAITNVVREFFYRVAGAAVSVRPCIPA